MRTFRTYLVFLWGNSCGRACSPEDVSEMLRRDPSYVLGMLDKLRRYRKPMEK